MESREKGIGSTNIAGSLSEGSFHFEKAVQRARHWLPAQGPIKDFVHHNTLHAFQHLRFHDAVSSAARLYGARPFMPGEFYLDAYRSGKITEAALSRALALAFPDESSRARAHARMCSGPIRWRVFDGLARAGLRSLWDGALGKVSLSRLAHPPLFRMIGGYLDQGLSIWRMPGADRLGFFDALAALTRSSWLPLYPYSSPGARRLLGLSASEAADLALRRLVGNEELYETYLLESLLAQPGWAGLVAQCEREPSGLLSQRRITLVDYAAVTLITDLACLEKALRKDFKPLSELKAKEGTPLLSQATPAVPELIPEETEEERLLSVWREAFEWSYYSPLLGGIASIASRPAPSPRRVSSWAFFCIDDRECSLRRHIEEADPGISTFATAGFFGLDFMYQGANDAVAAKHCPVPLTPRHVVIEEITEPLSPGISLWWSKVLHLEPGTNTFFRGWILSYALGFGAMLRLAASVFRPSIAPVLVPPLSTVSGKGFLRLTRATDPASGKDEDQGELRLGYTMDELADRVQGVLQSVGADERWPKLVVFFGHGSSSVNNPYFAAYNCGACSGRPGSPNARAFAQAANLPQVREILRSRGVRIPEDTWFVGALHDTSIDRVTYFDAEKPPTALSALMRGFQGSVEAALAANAAERCRRFEIVPEKILPEAALKAARSRAVSLFEPRPEYNHATNASCIVGRRSLTENLFLDRRAFLNSYDPTKDPDGKVLTGILSAVIPVCGGINLEYYFSRLDPMVYGAGSKLPQNVTGLIGVINGIEGDLLTGLPTQMTEIHDPVRLLLVVEQSAELALRAASRDPKTFEWIANGWIVYACVDPKSAEAFLYGNGRMDRLEGLEAPTRIWRNSREAGQIGRGNIPIGVIERKDGPPGKETRPC